MGFNSGFKGLTRRRGKHLYARNTQVKSAGPNTLFVNAHVVVFTTLADLDVRLSPIHIYTADTANNPKTGHTTQTDKSNF